jgi:DNA-directed RNA polymerase specialized sigma24 family protein
MIYRPEILKQKFKYYKDGDLDALEEIFESEKSRLFDFLIRMTGQQSKSLDTAEEAAMAVGPTLGMEENLQELLVLLYKTARNFTIENWNSDTSRLENSAYVQSGSSAADKNKPTLVALERVVRQLQAKQREVFLLHERFGFSPDEVAEVVGKSTGEVEELFASALESVDAAMPGEAHHVPELMTLLLKFPMPENEMTDTQNLSLVFKNLKKSSISSSRGWMKISAWLILLSFIGYIAWSNHWFEQLRIFEKTK